MRNLLRLVTREPLHHYQMDRFLLRSPIIYRPGERVVHIGGGPQRNHPLEINLNLFPGANIDIVGDAEKLPIADESIDVIISNAVLEHVRDLAAVTSEMNRVLKPGGHVYVEIPFVQHYHTHDGRGVHFEDYRRLTKPGLAEALKFCRRIDSGACVGPVSSVVQMANALAKSLWLAPWYQRCVRHAYYSIGNVLVAIDEWLPDHVIERSTIPSGIYFFGRKPDGATPWLDALPWPNSLYPRDLRAKFTLVSGGGDPMRVRITNISRTHWLKDSRLSWGCVQVGLQSRQEGVTNRDFRRIAMPRDIAPGESFVVDIDDTGLPANGRLLVDLVVEGLAWFGDRGNSPLLLPANARPAQPPAALRQAG